MNTNSTIVKTEIGASVEILKKYYEELTENLTGEFEAPNKEADIISGAFLCARDYLQKEGYHSTLKIATEYMKKRRGENEYPLSKVEVAEDIDIFLALIDYNGITA